MVPQPRPIGTRPCPAPGPYRPQTTYLSPPPPLTSISQVDWGEDGKYRGIISKYDATHPRAPWTIYYPKDGDEENGIFKRNFTEWHVSVVATVAAAPDAAGCIT